MNTPEQITVLARWLTPPERTAEVLGLVATLRERSLAEVGCLGYEVFRCADDPATILLMERYRHSAAIEGHRGWAHYRELVVELILPLLAGRQVELLHA
jgi:quinol monooxygenase YgiN